MIEAILERGKLEQDNTPRRLEKMIRDWAKIVYGREINKRPYDTEEQYEKLWKEGIVERAIGGFERTFGGDMQLAENQAVIPQLEKTFKPQWIADLKSQHALSERDYWRRKPIIEKLKKEDEDKDKGGIPR